jgi:DNA-binding MarR family transcriptional regulator
MMDNVVDDREHKDNQVDVQGWELVLLLLGGFRTLVDEAHALLDERGHAGARPAHGFALQAVGSGATTSQIASRLGVSKQAAAKTVAGLEARGYVARTDDPTDRRRVTVVRTPLGEAFLAASAAAFDDVVRRWRAQAGVDVDAVATALRRLDLATAVRLDLASWSG